MFTLHDARRSGSVGLEELASLGLESEEDATDRCRLGERADLVKGALLSAEVVSTVSSTYAGELKDPSVFGPLAAALRDRRIGQPTMRAGRGG